MRPETIEKYRNAIANVYSSIQKGEKILQKDFLYKYSISKSFFTFIQYELKLIEATSTLQIYRWLSPSNDFISLSKKYIQAVSDRNFKYRQVRMEKLHSKPVKVDIKSYIDNDPDKTISVTSRPLIDYAQKKEELKPELVKQFLDKSNILPIELSKLEARVLLVLLQQFAEDHEYNEFKNFIERISDKVFSKLY